MSKEIKISLFALVLVPLLAIWFFWKRPLADAKRESSPDPQAEQVGGAAPVAVAPPATSLAAPSEQREATVGAPIEPSLSLSAVEGEARARRFLQRRPTFRRDPPDGCNPPYVVDHDGNKLYKKECM